MRLREFVAVVAIGAAVLTGTGLTVSEAQASPLPGAVQPVRAAVTKQVPRKVVKKKVVKKKVAVKKVAAKKPAAGPVPKVTPKPSPAPVASGLRASTGRYDGPMVSITFDDGQIGHFTNARPALRAAHLNGTFYLISNALGWGTSSSMNADQAKILAAEGDEIGNHTRSHPNLASLSPDAVEAEFAQSQAALAQQVGVTPTTCAYPQGSTNESVQAIATKYFHACRGTKAGRNATDLAMFDLVTYYVHTSTSAADVRAAVEAAKAANSWVIFVYHGVGEVRSADDVSTDAFTAHLHEITASGINVRTVAAALAARGR